MVDYLLYKRVADRVNELILLAEAHYNTDFDTPKVTYTLTGSRAGTAHYLNYVININLEILKHNEDDYIRDTIAHEVAHLIDYKVNGLSKSKNGKRYEYHGKNWKEVMRVLGVEDTRTHNYYIPPEIRNKKLKEFAYECSKCKEVIYLSQIRHNRVQNKGTKYLHSKCKAALVYVPS